MRARAGGPGAPRQLTPTGIASAAALAVLAAFAGAQFDRLFVGHPVLGPVMLAAAVAAGASLLLRWRGASGWAVVVVQVVAFVVVLGAVLFAGSTTAGLPTPGSVSALRDGLANGWARLLSTTLPAKASGDLVALAPALTWVATVAGVEGTLRTRLRVPLLVPAAAVAGIAMAFTASLAYDRAVVAAVFVALAAGFLALRHAERRPGERAAPPPAREPALWGRVAGQVAVALPVLVCVALLGSVVGTALPFGHARAPADARHLYDAPVHPAAATNPLARLKAYLSSRANPVLLTVTTPDRGAAARWRWLVLDRYDGTSWSSSASFEDTGEVLPAPPAAATPPRGEVAERIQVGALPGPWIPSARWPQRLGSTGELVDPTDLQLLAASGSAAGTTLTEHTALAPVPTPEQVQRAEPATGATTQADRVVQPASLQRRLLAQAQQLTAGIATPYGQLAALRQWFVSGGKFTYDRTAPPGEGAAQLLYFLFGDTSHPHGSRRGTPEQFASAYALMARALGYPARVVVGFQAGPSSYDTARGAYLLRAQDVYAWVEVDFAGLGWVRIDPTPPLGGAKKTKADDDPVSQAQQLAARRPQASKQSPNRMGRAGVAAAGTDGPSGWLVAAWVVGGIVALVLLEGLALALVRAARRRRRRAGTARASVVGAWQEILDSLAAVSTRGLTAMTVPQVAAAAEGVVGPEHAASLHPLGSLVDGALYGGDALDDTRAAAAWETTHRFVRAVAATRPMRARLSWWFHPGGFRRPRWRAVAGER